MYIKEMFVDVKKVHVYSINISTCLLKNVLRVQQIIAYLVLSPPWFFGPFPFLGVGGCRGRCNINLPWYPKRI